MNRQPEIVKQIHDAAVALGAQCPQDCWFGDAQDQPMAYDSVKSLTTARAHAVAFLATATN